MNRRTLLQVPALLLCTTAVRASGERVAYTSETYTRLLQSGKPFMLDFYAEW